MSSHDRSQNIIGNMKKKKKKNLLKRIIEEKKKDYEISSNSQGNIYGYTIIGGQDKHIS